MRESIFTSWRWPVLASVAFVDTSASPEQQIMAADLHGFLGSPNDFTKPSFQKMTVQGAMDTLTSSGRAREMIVPLLMRTL